LLALTGVRMDGRTASPVPGWAANPFALLPQRLRLDLSVTT
jgi:hypothetical protein